MMSEDALPAFRPRRSALSRFVSDYGQEIVIACAILVLFAVVSAINPRFLAANNLNTIISGNAYIAVAAIGMSMVIITGNIDVSVGALIGVLATISGTLAVSGYPVWVAWLAPVLVGIAVNGVVGALVAYGRIPSIVVTLGMLSILRGGLVSVTGGAWISNLPPDFFLAQQRLLGTPLPVWIMLVLTIGAFLFMRYSAFGRSLYAIGGNAEAARATGIPVERRIVQVFMIHGGFAGLATILFATQLKIIQSTVPPNLELTIITASVIGGVSILGGTGTVIGSTLAAILFSAIYSALVFVNVSAYWLRAVHRAAHPRHRPRRHAAAQPRAEGRAAMTIARFIRHETILAVLVVVALVVLATQSDRFFTLDNLLNQGRLMTEVGLIAIVMTFVIVTGGIDLSVGSILGMTRHPPRRVLEECRPAARARHRPGARRRHLCRLRQRADHHPLPRAAADRDARRRSPSIAASPKACRRPARCAAIPNGSTSSARARCSASPPSSGCWPSSRWSPPSSSAPPPGAASPTPPAPTRPPPASPACASSGPSSPSTRPPASPPRSPP